MIKRLGLILILFSFSCMVNGQQIPIYSLYSLDPYLYNPAYGGNSNNKAEFALDTRKQNLGFPNSPFTNNLSFHMPIRGKNLTIGARFVNDEALVSNSRLYYRSALASFGYQLAFPEATLTAAVQAGVILRTLNLDLHPDQQGDQTLSNNGYNYSYNAIPTFGFGFYYKHNSGFYGGVSIDRIIPFKYDNPNSSALIHNSLQRHYFISAGYNYSLNPNISINPGALLKFLENDVIQCDFTGLVTFYQTFGIGASFRVAATDVFVPIAKLTLLKQVVIAYAYDYSLGGLQPYSNGSHEFMLKYLLDLGKSPKKIEVDPRYY